MQYSYFMVLLSVSLVVTTIMLCMVTKDWTLRNSILLMTTFDSNVHPFPPQPTSIVRNYSVASSNGSRNEIIPLWSTLEDPREYHYSTDKRLVLDAIKVSRKSPAMVVAPKIAFLFLVRGDIPFEPLWRFYFAGHEGKYSIYVHAAPNLTFPSSSFFFGKQIPSQGVKRMSRSLADAVRRLFAMAILDWERNNAWFVNLCEATIPLRSFNNTYEYLMGSHHSFVQAFQPTPQHLTPLPPFTGDEIRKGEVWMALTLKHAIALLEDHGVYRIFAEACHKWCAFDERYFQTLLSLKDPGCIANRTVMFVDWSGHHSSSPRSFDAKTTNARLLHEIASMTEDSIYGQHHDTAMFPHNQPVHCAHNGVRGAACFLFARKFNPSALDAAMAWLLHIEEFEAQVNGGTNHRR